MEMVRPPSPISVSGAMDNKKNKKWSFCGLIHPGAKAKDDLEENVEGLATPSFVHSISYSLSQRDELSPSYYVSNHATSIIT